MGQTLPYDFAELILANTCHKFGNGKNCQSHQVGKDRKNHSEIDPFLHHRINNTFDKSIDRNLCGNLSNFGLFQFEKIDKFCISKPPHLEDWLCDLKFHYDIVDIQKLFGNISPEKKN